VTRTQRLWLTFGPAALVASGVGIALTLTSDHEENPLRIIAIYLFICLSFIAAGLIGWSRRPQNRTGALMVAVGFSLFIGALNESDSVLSSGPCLSRSSSTSCSPFPAGVSQPGSSGRSSPSATGSQFSSRWR
jgi:hypothetical protein